MFKIVIANNIISINGMFKTLCQIIVSLLILSMIIMPGRAMAFPAPAVKAGPAQPGLPEALSAEDVSQQDWSLMRDQIAAARYHFSWQEGKALEEGGYHAPNPALGLGVNFGPSGLHLWALDATGDAIGLNLTSLNGMPAGRSDFSSDDNLVTRTGIGWQETLENLEAEIRYSLTLTAEAVEGETLTLLYPLSGKLTPIFNGESLVVQDGAGKTVFWIGAFSVVDASGTEYPAVFSLQERGLMVELSDIGGSVLPLKVTMRVWTSGPKLTAADVEALDMFGYAVAASGDVIVVGALWEDTYGSEAGAAYVFHRMKGGVNNWGEVTKLTASDAESLDEFGNSVSVSGDVIVVGARYEDSGGNNAGAAYVFQRMEGGDDLWGQVVKLTAFDAEPGDDFGWSVAVSGDVIVVGAPSEDAGGSGAGAAYVFQRTEGGGDDWGQTAKLIALDAENFDGFGWSVAASGDVITVGSVGEDSGGSSAGAAYVFQRTEGGGDNWGEVAKLIAFDSEMDDFFGSSIAVSGDVIVVGAKGEDTGGSSAGAAYVFHRMEGGSDQWGQIAKLVASDAEGGENFGESVAVSGDTILVGARTENTAGSNAGAAYLFHRREGGDDQWGEIEKLAAYDAGEGKGFGSSVSISGDIIVIGAYGDNNGAGAAYIFNDDAEVWKQTSKQFALDTAGGDGLGYTVAVSGDVIVVSAPWENTGGSFAGAAYVFHRMEGGADQWGEVTKLTASEPKSADYFGASLAISGDVIVIGSNDTNSGEIGAGAAYVYHRNKDGLNAWGEVIKLTASDAQSGSTFGSSVAVSGDVIVIGASGEDTLATNAGAAYVFHRNMGGVDAWGEVTKLTALDAEAEDQYGSSVAISGDVIVIGAGWEDAGGQNAGAVYVYHRMEGGNDNWGQVKKLIASDAQNFDGFGWSVAVSGDVIVVGAPYEDFSSEDVGAVYVFQRMEGGIDNWGEVVKLMASDAQLDDLFGDSVAISGDVIVVGAFHEDTGGSNAGAFYTFHRIEGGENNWGQVDKTMPSDVKAGDYFGGSVSVSEDVIVAGAYWEDTAGSNAGAFYTFQPDLSDADLSLAKTGSLFAVAVGEQITYTLTVSNAGPDPAENLTVIDVLPDGVTFLGATGNGWNCSLDGGSVICVRDSLGLGDAPAITLTVLAPTVVGEITNSALVTTDTLDPDPGNNSDDHVILIWEIFIYLPLIIR